MSQNIAEDKAEGLLIVLSGPSGAGKGTVVKELTKHEKYALSISVTTRNPRKGEIHGREYFFISEKEYQDLEAQGELLEGAQYVNNCYGTPRQYVTQQIAQGKTVILEIEALGAFQVKEKFPEAVLIFIIPPTQAVLKARLVGRNTEDLAAIDKRMARAMEELDLACRYDYLVVNHTIPNAVADIDAIVVAELLKTHRRSRTIDSYKNN